MFGYYLPAAIHRDLFEHLQADLEHVTELLTSILESKVGPLCDAYDVNVMAGQDPEKQRDRTRVVDLTNNIKKRISNLLEGLEEGDYDFSGANQGEKVYDGKSGCLFLGGHTYVQFRL